MRRLFAVLICVVTFSPLFAQETSCNDGIDNDGDGLIDCFDPDCASFCNDSFIVGGCQMDPPVAPAFTMMLDFSSANETTNHFSRLAVGDLDGDGTPEIITMNKYTNQLVVLDGNGGATKKSVTMTSGATPEWEIAIANIPNGNGDCAEIFFLGTDSRIYVYDCNLNFLYRTNTMPGSYDPINFGLADFDGDGLIEIYCKDQIFDAHTGNRLVATTQTDANWGTATNGGPVAVDMTGSADLELVIGLSIYQVNLGARTTDGGSLTLLSSRPEYFVRNAYNATSIADMDEDGTLDVIASGSTGCNGKNTTIFYWNRTTNTVKTYSDHNSINGDSDYTRGWKNGTGRVNIADLDGDGKLNLSYVSGGFLYALKDDMTKLWRVAINEETSGHTGCTLFDFNGDGKSEIVYRDEQYLYIIDGTDGSIFNQQNCVSRTNREYPIVADVDADGSTEICVTCGYDDALALANFNTTSYSRYSHVRVFKSAAEPWVPARRVWNQHGYFVVNINDDLTIPARQSKHNALFGVGSCRGEAAHNIFPLNKFLNQSPYLNSVGCPSYSAPKFSIVGAVTAIAPTCPDLNFQVSFTIINTGEITVSDSLYVSFYDGNPTKSGANKLATKAYYIDLAKNQTFTKTNQIINSGGADSLFVVLNDAGTSLPTPIVRPNTSILECDYDPPTGIALRPLSVPLTALAVTQHQNCMAPPTGSARAYVSTAGVENTADYNFYWFDGAVVGPIASADNTGSVYANIVDGDYQVFARHKTANCGSDTTSVTVTLAAGTGLPTVTLTATPQTICSPANGKLEALVDGAGGNAGYTFAWETAGGPIGVTGPVLADVPAGTYSVRASKNGCTSPPYDGTIPDNSEEPEIDAEAFGVKDCSDPNSGSVIATTTLNGSPQSASDYTFAWYFYDNSTSTRGSVVPAIPDATGPTRTDLAVGFYEVVATRISTQCSTPIPFVVEVIDSTSTPTVTVSELRAQTSCDLANPNGQLQAVVSIAGVPQPASDFTFEWFVGQNTLPANAHTDVSGTNGSIAEKVKGGGQAYTVKITTATNCSATDDGVVTQTLSVPVITLVPTPNGICNQALATTAPGGGAYTGEVTASVTFNGVAVNAPFTGYTFEWYDGNAVKPAPDFPLTSLNKISALDSGFYTLRVTNTNVSCVSLPRTAQVTNTTTLPILATASTASHNCVPGVEDGTASVVSVNGAAPTSSITFSWTGPAAPAFPVNNGTHHANTRNLIKVQGGAGYTYSVLVTNTNTGCSNTADVNVADGKVLPVVTLAATDNHVCAPATSFDGKVTASITPATISGTLANYTFAFGGGMVAGTQLASPNHNQYTKLNGGATAYTAVATHVPTGCVSSQVSIPVANVQDLPDLVTTSTASTNCNMAASFADGSASVVTVDGAAPTANYTFAWSGSVAPAFAVDAATNNNNTRQLIKVQGGAGYTYSVLVTNTTNGCTATANVNVADAKVLPVVTLATSPNQFCAPATSFDGSVTASITPATMVGAITNYTFAFGGGMVAGTQLASPNHNQYTKLNGGATAYTATATHTPTGCVSAQVSIPVANVQDLPDLTTTSTASTNCNMAASFADGTASVVTVDGAAAPGANYTYSWSGSVAPAFPVNAVTNNNNTFKLVKVQGGAGYTYAVLVTNTINGCTATANVNVADGKVLPQLTLTPQPNSICDPVKATLSAGAFNGSVAAVVNNIPAGSTTNDYLFTWSTGANGNGLSNVPGLDVGTYTVTALHNITGCLSNPYNAQVTNAKVLPAITMGQTPGQYCAGGAPDGTASVLNVVPNGQNYTYKWFEGNSIAGTAGPVTTNTTSTTNNFANVQGGINGVALFEYTAEVTILQTGCVSTATIGVDNNSQKPVVTLKVPVDNTNCKAAKNGSVDLNTLTYRGAPIASPYTGFTFAWSAGGTVAGVAGQNYTALAAGGYTLTVTNTNDNCISNPVPATIADDLFIPPIDIVDVDQTSCNPLTPNGQLTATVDETTLPGMPGVTAGYTFTWVNDVTAASTVSNVISNLKGDQTYTITAFNNSTECSSTQQIYLDETLVTPSIVVAVQPLTICNVPNGQLSATVTPVGPTYNYFWYNGSDAIDEDDVIANADFTGGSVYANLVPGDYTLVVRDAASECKSQQVIRTIVNNAPGIQPVAVNTVIPVDCSTNGGTLDGGVQLTANPNNFTTNDATDEITTTTPLGLAVNDMVVITRTGVLPLPLEADKVYFIQSIAGNVIKLSLTSGGAAINITANGIGSIGDIKTAGHTYEWYAGVPSPTDPLLGSINFFTNPPVYGAAAMSPTSTLTGISTGLYTLQVTNTATGCKAYLPHTLPFIGAHAVLKINKTNSTVCPYTTGNGTIEIQIEDPAAAPAGVDQNDYLVTLYQGGSIVTGPFAPVPPVNPFFVHSTLAPGSYTVEVRETYSGFNCPITQDVIIGVDALNPVVDLVSTTANTACNLPAAADGQIQIDVDKDPADLTAGNTYNIAITPNPNGLTLNGVMAGTYAAPNLSPGSYSFTVTDVASSCSSTKDFTVLNNPVKTQFNGGDLTIAPAEFCQAAAEESAQVVVNQIRLVDGTAELLADYHFTWTNLATSTVVFNDKRGDAIDRGAEFINMPAGGPVAAGTVWQGSYSLVAVKKFDASGSGGMGCSSPAFNITIGSQFVTPQITLTPTNDTSCDPASFEGSIEVDVTTASGPGMGGTYGYDWTPAGGAGQPTDVAAGNTGINNMLLNINDGSYSLIATNDITKCFATLSTTLIKETPPVFTITADAFNLTNCGMNDARINNIQVFIDGVGGTETDFDYTWFQTALTGTMVIDGTDDATYPVDDQLTSAAVDSYFIKAIRKAGGLGIGCESAPIRKDITNAQVFPQVSSTTISNSACLAPNWDGSITVKATTTGFGAGTMYDYTWTDDPGPAVTNIIVSPGSVASVAPVAPSLSSFSTYTTPVTDQIGAGNYIVHVLNQSNSCATDATVTVQQNTVPVEVVTTSRSPLTHCVTPDGQVSVTGIAVGGAAANLAEFSYNWTGTGGPYATITASNLTFGDYVVTATKNSIATNRKAFGCTSAPVTVTVLDKRTNPTVSTSSIANSVCVGPDWDGSITVSAGTTGFGIGTMYNYTWTGNPGGVIVTNGAAASAAPVAPSVLSMANYTTLATDRIGAGTYTLTATNQTNGCSTNASVVVQQNTVPINIITTSNLPLNFCSAPNGQVAVTGIQVGGAAANLAEFAYNWTGTGGPYATITVNNLTSGDYIVRATKNSLATNRTAFGCTSAPFTVNVRDERITPTVSLSQSANTACVGATAFDGQITVTATTPSGPGVGANYTFTWTNDPDGLGSMNYRATNSAANTPSPYSTLATDLIGGGSYSVNVVNGVTGCANVGTVIVQNNPALIQLAVTNTHQTICFPANGSITVGNISVNGVVDPAHGNFDFTWFSPTAATVIVGSTMGNDVLNNVDLPQVPAGTYFVKAVRRDLAKGAGCASVPVEVDILDNTKDPDLRFSRIRSDSSCGVTPLGVIEVTGSERTGPAGAYTFAWTLNGAPIAAPANTSPTTALLTNAAAGNYVVTVTNTATQCTFPQAVTLSLDTLRSMPSIVRVTPSNPTTCDFTASADVEEITVGGMSTFVSPFAMGQFNFEWYNTSTKIAGQTTSTLTGVNHGKYFVRVFETASSCRSAFREVVIDSALVVYPEVATRQTAPQVICDVSMGASGALTVTADISKPMNSRNNLANYEFSWYPNLTATGAPFALPLSDTTLVGRAEGNYSVLVRDVTTNCSTKAIFIIESDTTEFKPNLSLVGGPLTMCTSVDSYILANAMHFPTQNLPPAEIYPFAYNYSADFYTGAPADLDNPGPDLPNVPFVASAPGSISESFMEPNVPVGPVYTVRVTDLNTGCVSVDTVSVKDKRVFPAPLIDALAPVTNCDVTRPDGSAIAYLDTDGDGIKEFVGYQFDWYEGTVAGGTLVFDKPEFTEMKLGQVYTVFVTNLTTGCTASDETESEDGRLDIPMPNLTILSQVTSCDPANNGALSADVDGNTIDYTFAWFDNADASPSLSANTGSIYDSLVMDTYGVVATSKITGCVSPMKTEDLEEQPEFPDLNFQLHKATCGQENGSADIVISSSVPIKSVVWTNIPGQGSPVNVEGPKLDGVIAGMYHVVVTTILGCSTEKDFEIKTEIHPFNGISHDTPGQNDYFHIDCINNFTIDEGAKKDNVVRIYNRAGTLVYEAHGYDNVDTYFDGKSNKGVSPMGTNLPDGTYFYIVDKNDGSKAVAGYLEIVK